MVITKVMFVFRHIDQNPFSKESCGFEMNLIITKWLLVYVLEHKDNFHVDHFLSPTVKLVTV